MRKYPSKSSSDCRVRLLLLYCLLIIRRYECLASAQDIAFEIQNTPAPTPEAQEAVEEVIGRGSFCLVSFYLFSAICKAHECLCS